jgi:hypothetical protein
MRLNFCQDSTPYRAKKSSKNQTMNLEGTLSDRKLV